MEIIELIKLNETLEPETVKHFFPALSSLDVEKILVLKNIKDTTYIHDDFDVFENAVFVLNGMSPDVDKTEGCQPEWIWYAITKIHQLAPNKLFSFEVKSYVKFIFNDNGIYFYPPELKLNSTLYETVFEKSKKGPFPLKEGFIDIQTLKYLKILEYIKYKEGNK